MTAPTDTRPDGGLKAVRGALKNATQTLFAVTHNGMALLGLLLAALLVLTWSQPELRQNAERRLLDWLVERQYAIGNAEPAPEAIDRVTATELHTLPSDQAKVTDWLSRKYRVAREPLAALVAEAYDIGSRVKLDPTLILAVMAIESRFNPYAASPVGAHGLMQVLTRVHTDKYEDFGGNLAAFDPVSNLRVGVQVLRETIAKAGSVEGGLRLYVGAVSTDGRDYINKVLSEHDRLLRVARGQNVNFNAYQRRTPPPAAATPLMPALPNGPGNLEAEAQPRQVDAVAQAS